MEHFYLELHYIFGKLKYFFREEKWLPGNEFSDLYWWTLGKSWAETALNHEMYALLKIERALSKPDHF